MQAGSAGTRLNGNDTSLYTRNIINAPGCDMSGRFRFRGGKPHNGVFGAFWPFGIKGLGGVFLVLAIVIGIARVRTAPLSRPIRLCARAPKLLGRCQRPKGLLRGGRAPCHLSGRIGRPKGRGSLRARGRGDYQVISSGPMNSARSSRLRRKKSVQVGKKAAFQPIHVTLIERLHKSFSSYESLGLRGRSGGRWR